jgi:simple sugar transport system permease protein
VSKVAAEAETVVRPACGGTLQLVLERTKWLRTVEFALVPVIGLALVVGTIVNDAFFTRQNLINVLQQSSELSVLVIAETLVVIAGKFDLSLESIVGIAPMVAAWLVIPVANGGGGYGMSPYLGILVMFAVGAAVGLLNGFLIVRLELDAFIVTLAMLILLRGVTIGLSKGQTLYDLPGPLIYVGTSSWIGVPVSVWLAGCLFLLAGLFLRYHSFGRAIYAIGGNQEAARAAGIRVNRVLMITFVLAGTLAAVAGLMLAGRLASVTSGQGQNMIFFVFAAAVIGGIKLDGGRGSMFGALTGVLLLGIVANILTLSSVDSFWQNAVFGGIILAALVLAKLTGSRSGAG